jgi:hypothetical protein
MDDDTIKAKVNCCACGESLANSKNVNCVLLDHVASWKFPTWGNILYGVPVIGAIAILCDACLKKRANPTSAVEWSDSNLAQVTYHPVFELQQFVATKHAGHIIG